MRIIKAENFNKNECILFLIIYTILITNALYTKDSIIALISALCGITYTILAGKGMPFCYLIGGIGSAFYSYLAYRSAFWGNLILYAAYYIPMQITGFFQWNNNLKKGKNEIIKTSLNNRERLVYAALTICLTAIVIRVLIYYGDTSPYIDGITTVFSILGMYLTVKRTIEQWVVWILVNGLSLIMWLKIAMSGQKVYSTVLMWTVYFLLAIYFLFCWNKELKEQSK